jgi:hypothetical protein
MRPEAALEESDAASGLKGHWRLMAQSWAKVHLDRQNRGSPRGESRFFDQTCQMIRITAKVMATPRAASANTVGTSTRAV